MFMCYNADGILRVSSTSTSTCSIIWNIPKNGVCGATPYTMTLMLFGTGT